jgi:hypothetical protein
MRRKFSEQVVQIVSHDGERITERGGEGGVIQTTQGPALTGLVTVAYGCNG